MEKLNFYYFRCPYSLFNIQILSNYRGQKKRIGLICKTYCIQSNSYTNNANFITLWIAIEDSVEFQCHPAGHGINLYNKSFTKDVYRLLNENLNFVSTQKTFHKKEIDKEIHKAYRGIKLKANFKDTASHRDLTRTKYSKSHPASLGSF